MPLCCRRDLSVNFSQIDDWEQIKDKLSTRLPWESYQSWFARTIFRGTSGSQLLVSVPNSDTKEWVEQEFSEQVQNVVRELRLPYAEVVYVVDDTPANGQAKVAIDTFSQSESIFGNPSQQLNPRYTFDNFVVGSCNQFAHAAALAVSERPARTYNPLFIYGGSGMGKTHLMQAVGRALNSHYPSARVVYTTSERFMNQLITCIRLDRMSLFHQYYRTADILLVDDVHILAGKERTQEEFFHTFNELYDHQKQIVLSSDSAPKLTTGLVDRLRSRFEWGLLVDVQAPDLETKLAILDKKAEAAGVRVPDDVRVFIATRTKSSVRELEGALIRLIASSSVTGEPISLEMARHTLKQMTAGGERRITIDSIMKAVAERYTMPPAQLKQKSNARQITRPRQVAMFLAKELTPASLPEIGRAFGGKHHTTVLHSITKIETERQNDPDLNRLINSLIDSFEKG
ncbi:MAG: chromosomal replication initiator protein DnaA [Bryobacterales bacterium]|nr:chromosomal replication initiator protein DnaA [Bryobacterales bacterium]